MIFVTFLSLSEKYFATVTPALQKWLFGHSPLHPHTCDPLCCVAMDTVVTSLRSKAVRVSFGQLEEMTSQDRLWKREQCRERLEVGGVHTLLQTKRNQSFIKCNQAILVTKFIRTLQMFFG